MLFSAAYKEGTDCSRFWRLPGLTLLTSHYALEETRRHLMGEQLDRLAFLLAKLQVVEEPPVQILPAGVRLPEKDVPILAAAIQARATHLITGDLRDFGAYMGRRIGGVLILRPRGYFERSRRRRR